RGRLPCGVVDASVDRDRSGALRGGGHRRWNGMHARAALLRHKRGCKDQREGQRQTTERRAHVSSGAGLANWTPDAARAFAAGAPRNDNSYGRAVVMVSSE